MKNAILNSKKCISFLKKDKSVPYRTRFVKWHDELKLMIRKLNIIAVCKNSPVLESLSRIISSGKLSEVVSRKT